MQLEIRNNKDVWAGVMLIGTGAASVIIARDYRLRHLAADGTRLFPLRARRHCWCCSASISSPQGLRSNEKIEGNWSLRALVVLPLSLVLFGLLMEYAGFVPALMVLIVGSAAAGSEFKLIEVLLLAAGLTAFAVALFICGLGLPYPLFAAW